MSEIPWKYSRAGAALSRGEAGSTSSKVHIHLHVDEEGDEEQDGQRPDGEVGRVLSAQDAHAIEGEDDAGEDAADDGREEPGQHDGQEALGVGEVADLLVPQHAVPAAVDEREAHDGADCR